MPRRAVGTSRRKCHAITAAHGWLRCFHCGWWRRIADTERLATSEPEAISRRTVFASLHWVVARTGCEGGIASAAGAACAGRTDRADRTRQTTEDRREVLAPHHH